MNATVTATFTGANVACVATLDRDRGKAEVRVDGGAPVIVDLYSATLQGRRIVFAANGLAAGQHTIQIRVLGQKHSASSGTRVDVDALLVLQ